MGSFNHPSAGLEHSTPYDFGPALRSYPMRSTSASMTEMGRLGQVLRSTNSSAQDWWDNPAPGSSLQAAIRNDSPSTNSHPHANTANYAHEHHPNSAFNIQPISETHNHSAFGAQLDEIARARQGLEMDREESQTAPTDNSTLRRLCNGLFAAILDTTWMCVFLEALCRASG